MIKCSDPACGHENIEGEKYCEECGHPLEEALSEGSGEGMIKCSQGHLNDPDNIVCVECAEQLKELEQVSPQEPKPEEPEIAEEPVVESLIGRVKLVVEQGMTIGKQFLLNDPKVKVGRLDEDEGVFPDIDLTDEDEGYIHRKHAEIEFKEDKMIIIDLGGVNKTYVNNRPVTPNTPTELKMGDKIRIGKVVLRVKEA